MELSLGNSGRVRADTRGTSTERSQRWRRLENTGCPQERASQFQQTPHFEHSPPLSGDVSVQPLCRLLARKRMEILSKNPGLPTTSMRGGGQGRSSNIFFLKQYVLFKVNRNLPVQPEPSYRQGRKVGENRLQIALRDDRTGNFPVRNGLSKWSLILKAD